MTHSIAIIGIGKMGGAYAKSLHAAMPEYQLSLCESDAQQLSKFHSAKQSDNPVEAVRDAQVVLIAVKPQSFSALAKQLAGSLHGKLVISIMAGVSLRTLTKSLDTNDVIRCMPNLGVQVHHGMTAWMAGPEVTEEQKECARQIFAATGSQTEVTVETMIDAFTALAGSGPAYFFLLAEQLEQNAKRKGFSDEAARSIGREVLAASGLLMEKSELSPEELKNAVASKGGTTEAALQSLEQEHFASIFASAMDAAEQRSLSLES